MAAIPNLNNNKAWAEHPEAATLAPSELRSSVRSVFRGMDAAVSRPVGFLQSKNLKAIIRQDAGLWLKLPRLPGLSPFWNYRRSGWFFRLKGLLFNNFFFK
jgi:hypothetical protein